MNQRREIQMIGLDLDGTVLNDKKEISERSKRVIRAAIKRGVVVLPATGRPLEGIPSEFLEIEGIRYVLSANGAVIYDLVEEKKLYEDCMDYELVLPILHQLKKTESMVDVFIDGVGYVERENFLHNIKYTTNDAAREYLIKTRNPVDNLIEFVTYKKKNIEKITINFRVLKDGTLHGKEEVLHILEAYHNFAIVSGVPTNLEITKKTATKGNGLLVLGQLLGIEKNSIMAVGDSGNDIEMLQVVGLGVAMENSTQDVIEVADFVTKSNEEDGVACAIEHFVLNSFEICE
ncbi:MAG: Cof-type HAD-IIB family hydrolase [Velocimicrobium sp.]